MLTISVVLSAPTGSETQTPEPSGADSNKSIFVPQYVLYLYRNFSKEEENPKPQPTVEYNTIRSFENTEGCSETSSVYTYMFDTTAISKQELIFKANLRVYFEVVNDPQNEQSISLTFLNDTIIRTQNVSISTPQWMEFQVAPAVEEWLRGDINETGFKIVLEQNVYIRPSCDENPDNITLLVVYSYDTGDSFLKQVEKAVEETKKNNTESEIDGVTIRNTRNSDSECGMTSLTISKEWINKNIYDDGKYGVEIVGPDEIYINACGGSCEGVVPLNSEHSSILYLLKGHDTGNEYDRYKQCCVPIKYNDLSVIMTTTKAVMFEMKYLRKLSVKQCECIYTRLSDAQLNDEHPIVV